MHADIADRTPEERFRWCCRFRQFHCQSCAQARRWTYLDGGSAAVDGLRSGCAGGECNSVPFDLSSTDRSAGCCAPIVACSSNHVTRIAKILDAPRAPSAREKESYSLSGSGFSWSRNRHPVRLSATKRCSNVEVRWIGPDSTLMID